MSSHSPTILYPPGLAPPSSIAVGAALDRIAYGSLCVFVFALSWQRDTGLHFIPWLGLLTFGITLLRTVVLVQGRRLCEVHVWMLAFAAWSSASIVWTADLDSTAFRVGTYLQLLLLAWVIWVLVANDARVLGLFQSYVLGTYVIMIGTISNAIAGVTSNQFDDIEAAKGNRYIMTGMNPNATAELLVPSIFMTLYLLARRKRSALTALLCWPQLVLCATTILLSGSRTAVLEAVPALAMFPLIVPRLLWWQKVLAVMTIAGTVIGGAFVPSETWQRIFQFGSEVTEGTMDHRTEIWKGSVELFRGHAFVGVGSGAHAAAVAKVIDRPLVAHNTFLSVLVELGVVGELLLLGLLGAALYCALQMPGLERALWTLTLAAWCIGACSGTLEYRKGSWFLLGLLAAHTCVWREARSRVVYRHGPPRSVYDNANAFPYGVT